MSSGRPWKLYLALEGEPRQLIDTFATLKEAGVAFAEIVGVEEERGRLLFTVVVDIHTQAALTARLEYSRKATPYVVELVE